MAKLTYKQRKRLKKSSFALPGRRYPIHDRCISGETTIPLLSGETVKIKDIVGEEVFVYSFDLETMSIVPGRGYDIRKTNSNEYTIKIILDNGEYLICTPDHPILMRGGIYKIAGDIVVGDSIMPLYRKTVLQRSQKEYEKIYQPYYRFWEFTHHMVYRGYNKEAINDGYVIHHKDRNQFNNIPENLEHMSRSAHIALHGELYSPENFKKLIAGSIKRWEDPEAHRRQSEFMKKENERRRTSGELYEIGEKIAQAKLKYTKDEVGDAYRMYINGASLKDIAEWWNCCVTTVKDRLKREGLSSKREICEINNHKVTRIEPYKNTDVFNMEVEKYNNFAINSGVFIHNSHAINALARVAQHGTPSERARVRAAVCKKYPSLCKKK